LAFGVTKRKSIVVWCAWDFHVLYTRAAIGGRILRRRECRHCGRRLTTYEKGDE